MAQYDLRAPVEAVRYSFRSNETEIKTLVAATRDSFNVTNAEQIGIFRIYNGGPEIVIHDGDWVVVVASEVLVVPDAVFSKTFNLLG